MKKRIVLCLLAVCLLVSLIPAVFAGETLPVASNNLNAQEYQYNRWSSPVESYLHPCEDGSIMRVEYTEGKIVAERYDKALNMISQQFIQPELELFGGFGSYGGYYFLVFGQTNHQEDNSREVYRVVQYDQNWQRLGAASLYGENTTVPFDAGSLRMVGYDNMLYIRTCHEMYTSNDGLNHQANVTIVVDIRDMSVADAITEVVYNCYGYCSHSFNQFIALDGDRLITADHGDAYPRAAVLFRSRLSRANSFVSGTRKDYETVNTLDYYGAIGENDTGATMGALAVSDSHYLIIGSTVRQDGSVSLSRGQHNIYISATDKDHFTSDATKLHYLTSFADDSGVDLSVPYLVDVGSGKYLALWRENTDDLKYVFVSGNGEAVSQVYSGKGSLSDCQPVCVNGKVIWYVTEGGGPVFYTLDLSDPSTVIHTDPCRYGHNYLGNGYYEPTADSEGTVYLACKNCGHEDSVTIPPLNKTDYAYSVSSEPECTYGGWGVYRILVYGTHYHFYEYLPELGHDYVDSVCTRCGEIENHTHSYTQTYTEATCTEPAYRVNTCQCGSTYQEAMGYALGHSWDDGKVTREPTVEAEGERTFTCTVCGETTTESIPKLHGPGKPCPSYSFITMDGSKITDETHAGKVRLYIFYRTACGNSQYTISTLSPCSWLEDPRLAVLAVNMEDAPPEELREFANAYANGGGNITFASAPNYVMWNWLRLAGFTDGSVILPVSILVDQEGMIRWYSIGYTAPSVYKTALSPYLTENDDPCAYGHSFDLLVTRVEPTFQEEGKVQWSCSVCHSYGMETLPVLNDTDYTVTHIQEASCGAFGIDEYVWKNGAFGRIAVRVSLPRTEHTWQGEITQYPTRQEYGKVEGGCENCSATFSMTLPPLSPFFYDYRMVEEPSCTETGLEVYTYVHEKYGSYEIAVTLAATGHSYTPTVTAPTCTEAGYTTYTCACGDSYTDSEVAALGHDGITDAGKAPTCTEEGLTEGSHCGRCGEVLAKQETVAPKGHSWGQWVETVKPDETRDGVDTRMCTVCKQTQEQIVDNNIFSDVKTDRFEAAILWAYYNNITTGTGDGTTFSPENACTRKQIVTFLWRAAGEPEPESMVNPFKDVKSDRFEKAILWAYYAGITAGTGDGSTFSPENTCTRKQIVTFLWRYNGQPAPKSMENKFVDVKNDRFTAAILWAAEQGITTGTGDGTTFSPEDPCTRKQIVTFLFRNLNKEEDK